MTAICRSSRSNGSAADGGRTSRLTPPFLVRSCDDDDPSGAVTKVIEWRVVPGATGDIC